MGLTSTAVAHHAYAQGRRRAVAGREVDAQHRAGRAASDPWTGQGRIDDLARAARSPRQPRPARARDAAAARCRTEQAARQRRRAGRRGRSRADRTGQRLVDAPDERDARRCAVSHPNVGPVVDHVAEDRQGDHQPHDDEDDRGRPPQGTQILLAPRRADGAPRRCQPSPRRRAQHGGRPPDHERGDDEGHDRQQPAAEVERAADACRGLRVDGLRSERRREHRQGGAGAGQGARGAASREQRGNIARDGAGDERLDEVRAIGIEAHRHEVVANPGQHAGCMEHDDDGRPDGERRDPLQAGSSAERCGGSGESLRGHRRRKS
jgi:hypothetical protein